MGANSKVNIHGKTKAYVLLPFFLLLSIAVSLLTGSYDITINDLLSVISGGEVAPVVHTIITEIRLPRILLAVAVGGGLSVVGAVFQAVLLNPLAEPYILGISSGGTFGAVLSFLLGLSFAGTQFFAFSGAVLVMLLVYYLSKRFGELEPNILLLSGVMIGAFFSAAILLMIAMLENNLRNAIFWLIGNLSVADAKTSYYILPAVVVLSIVLSLNSYKMNLLTMGDSSAKHLGINPTKLKGMLYLISSVLVGLAVSVSGIVGFVGLLIPHVCRMLLGVDNRLIIPASFFAGSAYLVLADIVARTVIAPAEIPVGAVTALIGAPVFIYLLRKQFYFY